MRGIFCHHFQEFDAHEGLCDYCEDGWGELQLMNGQPVQVVGDHTGWTDGYELGWRATFKRFTKKGYAVVRAEDGTTHRMHPEILGEVPEEKKA